MKLIHKDTGDVLELPRPGELGDSVVRFNGRVVERVLYTDDPYSVTLGSGRAFTDPKEFSAYIFEQLRSGAYRHEQDGVR
jgi:hypothetical protein